MISFSASTLDRRKLAELQVPAAITADDGVDYTGVVVRKPWGSEVQIRKSEHFAVTRLLMLGGRETSMHCHTTKTVLLMVERGNVALELLSGAHALAKGDAALIEKCAFHRIAAKVDAEILEIEWPPNKRDLVRLEDRNGRGQGYEVARESDEMRQALDYAKRHAW